MSGYRLGFLAGVAAVYLTLFAASAIFGWTRVWDAVGVRTMGMSFPDIRAFTGADFARARELDPLHDNPGDPWGRPANAPRIWIAVAAALHLTARDTNIVGGALFLAFMAALALLSRLIGRASDAILLGAFAVSPAALFSIERGKIDSIVFLIVCAAILAARREWIRISALTAASILKVFPFFGLAVSAINRRRIRWNAVAAMALIALYAYAIRDDLRHMDSAIPVTPLGAYGIAPLSVYVSWLTRGRLSAAGASAVAWIVTLITVIAGAAAGERWLARDQAIERLPKDREDAFAIGAAIYAGSFLLVLNYDYRLVFLLPAVPFFNAARLSMSRGIARFGLLGLAALAVAMSETPLTTIAGGYGTKLNIAAKLVLLAVGAAGLTAYLRRALRR